MGQIGGERDVLGWNEGLLREVLWLLGWIGRDEDFLGCNVVTLEVQD